MLTTMVLKEMGVKYVVAKAVTELHGRFLEKIGADLLVYPEMDSGRRLGMRLAKPNIVEQIEFGADHGVFEITVPKGWVGKTLGELNVRAKHGLSVLAVREASTERKGEENAEKGAGFNISPMADTRLKEGDTLLVLGQVDDIKKVTD